MFYFFINFSAKRQQLLLDIYSLGDKLKLRKEPLTLITVTADEKEYSSSSLLTAMSQFLPHKYSEVGILRGGGARSGSQAVTVARDRRCHVATREAITDAAYRDAALCVSL